MSVVTIQIGQCGNQVGYNWYTTLGKETGLETGTSHLFRKNSYFRATFDRWFYPAQEEGEDVFARAVLVDTEQKVINDVCKQASRTQMWKYNPKSIVCQKDGGSGNNWALGFCQRGPEMHDAVLNSIRKEVEKCERLSTIHNILSCAGGTGSGLGSSIIAHVKDEYPSKASINSLIFPYKSGEIMTQNYNSVLTLSKIYDISDMHFIFQNDDLHKTCSNLCENSQVELQDLNSLISVKLLSCLQPLYSRSRNYLPALISDLSPHPCYKLATVRSAPHFSSQSSKQDGNISWSALLKYMLHSLRLSVPNVGVFDFKSRGSNRSPNLLAKYSTCVSNVLITRGGENVVNCDTQDFHNSELYPDWIPSNSTFHHFHQEEKLLGFNKFVSLISNSSSVCECLDNIVENAWKQFTQKAYLHQYTKYGLEDDDFAAAFVKMENIMSYYKALNTLES